MRPRLNSVSYRIALLLLTRLRRKAIIKAKAGAGLRSRGDFFIMGTWGESITGNDTAQDLLSEYRAAFYKYDVPTALKRIDDYVRGNMFDEADEGEWCNYIYSLADFMWKKGILTEDVKQRAIHLIDTGFGLDPWAESGDGALAARKRALEQLKAKLLSDMPPKKRIKPDVHEKLPFAVGDIVAIQLQTAGKHFCEGKEIELSDEAFHAYDRKFILMQFIGHFSSWSSFIVPEVKDYWARFMLLEGIYDGIPMDVDPVSLKPAKIHDGFKISTTFTCESSIFYFRKRKYQVVGNCAFVAEPQQEDRCFIYLSERVGINADSKFIASMGKEVSFAVFDSTRDQLEYCIDMANQFGRFNYKLSREENRQRFALEKSEILKRIDDTVKRGGQLLSLRFGNRVIGICTVLSGEVGNLYIEGRFQKNGFGTQLLRYALSLAGKDAFLRVPRDKTVMLHLCEKLGLFAHIRDDDGSVRFSSRSSPM
ncbi:MAG: hypothetical protein IJM56_03565 [Clostridia bacterium]|nr:hypothetical protein [Clostridia bacterium]